MNILLPFQDDSSLILASIMGQELTARGTGVTYAHVVENLKIGSKISGRQMRLYLPDGPDLLLDPKDLVTESLVTSFDAIVTCRLLKSINKAMDQNRLRNVRKRACFVAFWAGLDFSPHKGVVNRCNYDVVFLLRDAHRRYLPPYSLAFYIGRGHPYFIRHAVPKTRKNGHIVFATQSISPLTLAGRVHMANVLVACALANPEREIMVKLRHKTDENRHHSHKEVFGYEDIVRDLYPRVPSNLSFGDGSMEAALSGAAGCFTCTSTALMDALAAGVPSMAYLDYPGAAEDPLCGAMRAEFSDSNLIGTNAQLLSLDFPDPDPQWMAERFTTPALYDVMLEQIDRFHTSREG